MAAPVSAYKDRQFVAVIGDEDSVTGLLLAGIGHITDPPDSQKNFLVCDSKTEKPQIEQAFNRFTKERKDIGIVLINQHIAEQIRDTVDRFQDPFPAVLEIPSKDHPYDPEKDSVLRRAAAGYQTSTPSVYLYTDPKFGFLSDIGHHHHYHLALDAMKNSALAILDEKRSRRMHHVGRYSRRLLANLPDQLSLSMKPLVKGKGTKSRNQGPSP
ncbi:V-type proton ATPase subunit F [Fonsecaea nubica]|uniref:V-type proton ATPase subunit F n=1 Tax=Fonsecaea nubica TaxID=856822 RepID=A0A178CT00_9EURO|nr:V-type proton ATPase subunit F [Fonsecaea nubica]OAL32587.1 V-type proton ATPase subunit F [Fonsecaea nubica]